MQVLLRVTKQRRAREWLTQLVAMHMSLHSMEVVNRLTSATQLPPGFLQPYISNCIASCQRAAVRSQVLWTLQFSIAPPAVQGMLGGARGPCSVGVVPMPLHSKASSCKLRAGAVDHNLTCWYTTRQLPMLACCCSLFN